MKYLENDILIKNKQKNKIKNKRSEKKTLCSKFEVNVNGLVCV